MSENTTDQSSQERRVGPTVSRDKWQLHARQKLSKGYKLIVARDGKKRANFWTAEKGFEMCAYEVARALVQSGEVVQTGEHPLGLVYELVQPETPAPKPKASKPKPPKVVPPVEEETDLLDGIATDEESEDDVADDEVDLDVEGAEETEDEEDDLTDLDDDEDVKL